MRLAAFFILLFCGIAHAQTTVPGQLLNNPLVLPNPVEFTGAAATLSANGQGSVGGSTTLGALITGQGSTNDITLKNKSGVTVCSVATAATLLGCTGLSLTLGSDATGDLYYRNSSGNFARLAIGSTGNALLVSGGLPSWGTISTTVTAGTTVTSGITTGDIISSTSNKIADSGLAVASFATPSSYGYPYNFNSCLTSTSCVSSGVTAGQLYPLLNGSNVFYSSGVIPEMFSSLNPIVSGYGNSSIPSQSFNAKTFSLQFVSSSIATQTVTYTGNSGDTQATVASQLCAAVQANTTLVSPTTGGPFVCDPAQGGGGFNLQYAAPPILATPTVTSVGTGTITLASRNNNLDGVFWTWQRRITGYAMAGGDGLYCNVSYFNSTPTYLECTNALTSSTIERNFTTLVSNVAVRQFGVSNGVALTGSDANPPYGGQGTLTIPNISGGGTLGFASNGEGAFDAQVRENTSNNVIFQMGIGEGFQYENHAGSTNLFDYNISHATAFTFAQPVFFTNLPSGTATGYLCITATGAVIAQGGPC